jgi:hypothetical protein
MSLACSMTLPSRAFCTSVAFPPAGKLSFSARHRAGRNSDDGDHLGRDRNVIREKKLHGQATGAGVHAVRALAETAGWQPSRKVFLLSPANAGGARARLLLSATSELELVVRLRRTGAPLGEIFSFMSSLYFRGKLTYSQRFAAPPTGTPGVLVITPSRGLVAPEHMVTLADLEEMTRGEVHHENESYCRPLMRDAQLLMERLEVETKVVLLGSIATPKYVKPLLEIFGERLMFPAEFVGIGDMSRGGLLLRSFREETELKYVPIAGAQLSTAKGKLGERAKSKRAGK